MTVRVSADPAPVVALRDAASAIASARRAALADRYAANSFTVEWRPLAELEPIAAQWRALAARALEPNVFYEPAFALAAAPVFGREAGAVLVWSAGSPRRLLGFFPARIETPALRASICRFWSAGPIPTRRSACRWSSAKPPSRSSARFVAHLAADPRCRDCCCCRFCRRTVLRRPRSTPFCDARRCRPPHSTAIAGRCWRRTADRAHYVEGAIERPPAQGIAPAAGGVLPKRAPSLFTIATEPAAVDRALEDFFPWKRAAGRAGPARRRPPTRSCSISCAARLFRLAAEQKVSINRLLVDGRVDCRDHRAAQRPRRLVLENRLQRRLCALLARRDAERRIDRANCSTTHDAARRFLRHGQSSHDRSSLARAVGAMRSPVAGPPGCTVRACARAGRLALCRARRRQIGARLHPCAVQQRSRGRTEHFVNRRRTYARIISIHLGTNRRRQSNHDKRSSRPRSDRVAGFAGCSTSR